MQHCSGMRAGVVRGRFAAGLAGSTVASLLAACTGEGTEDISVTACTADPAGGKPVASGTIVNRTSKASTYVIRITFRDSDGNQVSQGIGSVARVEPGGEANWSVSGAGNAAGNPGCEASAERSEAPG